MNGINLDLRSLAVMAGLMGAVLGLVLFGLRRSYPASIEGLRAWAWAPPRRCSTAWPAMPCCSAAARCSTSAASVSMAGPSPGGCGAAFGFSVLLVSIGVLLMASERLRLEFEHIASHDTLTGALSRRALLECCQHELERCRRYGRPAALLMLDIDHFKAVNDRHGHLVGDRVLREVVDAVRQALRQADRIGRYGGEEFVVLLPETDRPAALAVAERMRLAVARRRGAPACTTSIGLSCLQAEDAGTDALLARADAALYRAKAQGRNRVEAG